MRRTRSDDRLEAGFRRARESPGSIHRTQVQAGECQLIAGAIVKEREASASDRCRGLSQNYDKVQNQDHDELGQEVGKQSAGFTGELAICVEGGANAERDGKAARAAK